MEAQKQLDSQNKHKWPIWVAIAALLIIVIVIIVILVINATNSQNNSTTTTTTTDNTSQTSSSQTSQQTATPTSQNCISDSCLEVSGLEYPAGELPADIATAVRSAIDDEYKAYSTYDATITKLGQVRPFAMIIRAEESHIASLEAIFDKYGAKIPANPYAGKITAKDTLKENCQVGVDAEIANIALYRDTLLPKVTSYPDITSVFTTLMNASQNKHLPAFEQCN